VPADERLPVHVDDVQLGEAVLDCVAGEPRDVEFVAGAGSRLSRAVGLSRRCGPVSLTARSPAASLGQRDSVWAAALPSRPVSRRCRGCWLRRCWPLGASEGVRAAQGIGYPEPASHMPDQLSGVGARHSGGGDEQRARRCSAPDRDGMGSRAKG
jgi:hypothetical protein